MLSKQPLISPSSTHSGECFPLIQTKTCSQASCVLLNFLKPNDVLSPVASAICSNAKASSDCIALSYMVGIPKGRFFLDPCFSMYTLFNGFATYFLSVRLRAAFILASGDDHNSPSTPAVLLPVFCVGFLVANSFA